MQKTCYDLEAELHRSVDTSIWLVIGVFSLVASAVVVGVLRG
jgi:hypothetical protein